MAFLSKPRGLPDTYLCGNPLPWVNSLKHLGTRVSNCIDGCQLDMKQKNAQYIDKNCTLDQEFHFAHPSVKLQLNTIYNCHYSGSQVCNLFSQGARSLESTFNRSVKVMANLPYQTHRYMTRANSRNKAHEDEDIEELLELHKTSEKISQTCSETTLLLGQC